MWPGTDKPFASTLMMGIRRALVDEPEILKYERELKIEFPYTAAELNENIERAKSKPDEYPSSSAHEWHPQLMKFTNPRHWMGLLQSIGAFVKKGALTAIKKMEPSELLSLCTILVILFCKACADRGLDATTAFSSIRQFVKLSVSLATFMTSAVLTYAISKSVLTIVCLTFVMLSAIAALTSKAAVTSFFKHLAPDKITMNTEESDKNFSSRQYVFLSNIIRLLFDKQMNPAAKKRAEGAA